MEFFFHQERQQTQGTEQQQLKQGIHVWSAGGDMKVSAMGQRHMPSSVITGGVREAHHIQYIRAAVRNRRRRWRRLAQEGMLTISLQGPRKRRKDPFKLSQPQADFDAEDNDNHDEKFCSSLTRQRDSAPSWRATSDASSLRRRLCPPTAPPARASPATAATIDQQQQQHPPPQSIPSPPSLLEESRNSPPSILPSAVAAAFTDALSCNGEFGSPSPSCRTDATTGVSPATVAADTSSAFSRRSATDEHWLLNPPSFAALGVPPALIRVAASLHIERPSPIQLLTLPRALQGGDLCGVAPTGTGKTLCYCWPLLQRIACGHGHAFLGLVLLPARELAVQVLEQFRMYGASLGTRVGVLLGGRDLTEEGKMLLHQAPHILIATPGRLADNVQNNLLTMQQRLSVVEVLVLDEADMLLSDDFKDDLKCILACLPPSSAATAASAPSPLHNSEILTDTNSACVETSHEESAGASLHCAAPSDTTLSLGDEGKHSQELHTSPIQSLPDRLASHAKTQGTATGSVRSVLRIHRQTLLFSATVSPALLALQQQRFGDALMPLFDATTATTVAAAAEVCHLNETTGHEVMQTDAIQESSTQQQILLPRLSHYYLFVPTAMRFAYLLYLLEHVPPFNRDRGIIFAGSVRQTQRLCTALEVLRQQVTSLHSLMKQRTRIACLEKFRGEVARLLVCTDVAGRGLDLPRVEFVICLDVPSKPEVYVHRTGRTARAGRKGIALTFVDPSGTRAVHRIEACIHRQLKPLPSFSEDEVLQHLNHYSRVLQKAALFLNEIGFDEKAEQHEAYSTASKEMRRRTRDTKPLLV